MDRRTLKRHLALSLLSSFLLGLVLSVAPAFCQGPLFVATWKKLSPNPTRPGRAVEAVVRVLWEFEVPESATLDISSLGLPSALPMARAGSSEFEATFTVPPDTAPGDYPIFTTARGITSSSRIPGTLRVTLGVLVESMTLEPNRVQAGESATLTAVVSPGNQAVASVTADLSRLGLSNAVPLGKTSDDTWQTTFQVPAGTPEGHYPVIVQVRDTSGGIMDRSEPLEVYIRRPILFTFGVGPNPTRAGRTVTAKLFSEDAYFLGGATMDLSALGLSATAPFTSGFTTLTATFTVPSGTTPGEYPVVLSVHNSIEVVKVTETLWVTAGPIVDAQFERSPVPPGGTATLLAAVDPGASPTAAVTADLSAFGLTTEEPMRGAAEPGKYSLSFTVPLGTVETGHSIPVTAADAEGRSHTAIAGLWVQQNVPLVFRSLSVQPSSVRPGETATLVMEVDPYTGASTYVTAVLSTLGLPAALLPATGPATRALTFTVPANTPPGEYTLTASVTEDMCTYQTFHTTLRVSSPALRVKRGAPGPTHDGKTWATAYTSVQTALDAAQPGDEVWAAAATYLERVTMKNGVALYGGFSGTETERAARDPKANATVLDAQRNGIAVTMASGPLPTVLDGFTVRNGAQANVLAGGLVCENGTAVLTGNVFEANHRAIAIRGGTARLERNTVTNSGIPAVSAHGAAITLTGNTIRNNRVEIHGFPTIGPAMVFGGGLSLINCTGSVLDNVISENGIAFDGPQYAVAGGGGINVSQGDLAFRRNTITRNFVSAFGFESGGAHGAGLLAQGGKLVVSDNLIANNGASGGGGEFGGGASGAGLSIACDQATVVNNTIVGNNVAKIGFYGQTQLGAAGLSLAPAGGTDFACTVANNIVAGNTSGVAWAKDTPVTWRHNDVHGNTDYNYAPDLADPTGLNGNISVDPLFADPANGDYRLRPNSPAIDAGDSALAQGPYDRDGKPRIQGKSVDIGAYEHPWLPTLADVASVLRVAGGLASAAGTSPGAFDVAGGGPDRRAPDGKITLVDAMALYRAHAMPSSVE